MKQALLTLLLLTVSLCQFLPTFADKVSVGSSTAVTAVSDTTDTDTVDSGSGAVMASDSVLTFPTSTGPFLSQMFKYMDWGVGTFFLFHILIFILILLAPIGVLVLIIYLLVRNHRQREKLAEISRTRVTNRAIPVDYHNTARDERIRIEKKRDRSIRCFFLGLAIFVVSLLFHIKILIVVGVLLGCYGLSEWINVRRRFHEHDNDNTKQ